eukprot:3687837-Heterocapsa_arctica.AAC.1
MDRQRTWAYDVNRMIRPGSGLNQYAFAFGIDVNSSSNMGSSIAMTWRILSSTRPNDGHNGPWPRRPGA